MLGGVLSAAKSSKTHKETLHGRRFNHVKTPEMGFSPEMAHHEAMMAGRFGPGAGPAGGGRANVGS